MTNDDAGALSSQGRFQRMEEALYRIEQKLDSKADLIRLEALENHIRDLEAGRVIPPLSQVYLTRFTDLEKNVEVLTSREEAREAVMAAREKSADTRVKWVSLAASAAIVVNIGLGAAVTFSALLR